MATCYKMRRQPITLGKTGYGLAPKKSNAYVEERPYEWNPPMHSDQLQLNS